MSKFGTIIAFLAGAAIGGVAVWYYTKEKYTRFAEEEINSVKETYARRNRKENQNNRKQINLAKTTVQEKDGMVDYSQQATKVVPTTSNIEAPYIIPPEAFGEWEDYTTVSLIFFADGVLSDEYGIIVDDVEEMIGSALNHFDEYEDDSVFCRSDPKRCDYEILKDFRTYADFRKTFPPNI